MAASFPWQIISALFLQQHRRLRKIKPFRHLVNKSRRKRKQRKQQHIKYKMTCYSHQPRQLTGSTTSLHTPTTNTVGNSTNQNGGVASKALANAMSYIANALSPPKSPKKKNSPSNSPLPSPMALTYPLPRLNPKAQGIHDFESRNMLSPTDSEKDDEWIDIALEAKIELNDLPSAQAYAGMTLLSPPSMDMIDQGGDDDEGDEDPITPLGGKYYQQHQEALLLRQNSVDSGSNNNSEPIRPLQRRRPALFDEYWR